MKKIFVYCLFILFLATINTNAFSGQAEFKWDMPNEYGVTSLAAETDNVFIKKLDELTNGRIKITYHPGASLGYKTADHFDAVGDGAIPLASSFMAPLRGIDPIFSLISLPFVCTSIDESRTLMEIATPYFDKLFKKNNQFILYTSPWPTCGIWAKKAVKSASDLKDLRLRVYDPSGTKAFTAAGASTIQLTWADIVPQLSTGGINSVLTSAEGGVFAKFWDFLDNYTELNYISPLMVVHMNLDAFNKLPKDLQDAVKEAAKFAEDYGWKKVHERAEKNYAELEKNGVVVTKTISKEFYDYLKNAGKGAVDDWANKMGKDGAKILEEFNKRVGR